MTDQSLSRSLVDAAAEAIAPDADKQTFVDGAGEPGSWLDVWQPQARAAVAAVLETLAAHVADQHPIELVDLVGYGKAYNEGKSYVIELMRRLAAEAREEQA